MKGIDFLWEPPTGSGRIVSAVNWHDDIIIACERIVYRLTRDGDGNVAVVPVDFDGKPKTKPSA